MVILIQFITDPEAVPNGSGWGLKWPENISSRVKKYKNAMNLVLS
jgi:hypothetical protein